MEVPSPYLQAIQKIAGAVPGEKYRELNLIAKRIADGTGAHGDSPACEENVPSLLLPLIKLEIADILRNYEGVVEALQSEDKFVLDRALSKRWFFRGDNEDVATVDYFEKNIWPCVSFNTRIRVVKRLASNLRASGKTEVANKFYTHLAEKYGLKQAEPMLAACDENFIYDAVTAKKIILPCRMVRILFVRYPKLVIRYFKLSNINNDDCSRDSYAIDLSLYSNFLPRLIKNHTEAFVEIVEKYDVIFGLRLSSKASTTFLKTGVDAVLEKPEIWVKLMPLKVVAAKLTKPQYQSMIVKLFPKKKQQFDYDAIKDYLEYYPEQERMELVMDSYKKVYNANLLDNTDAIGVNFMCMLPARERERQARIKLAKEPDWRKFRYNIERVWRCYLPIEESIPSIKNEIAKTSSVDDRSSLLSQMFYSCKVNDDKEALLEGLRYFTNRHKNEQSYAIFDVLDHLTDYFDLSNLSEDHWIVINDFIRFLHVKGELMPRSQISKTILVAGVLHNLNHDLPIEDKMTIIMEINITGWNQSWCILPKHPEYDRLCLDMFLTMLPNKHPEDDKIWKNRNEVIEGIMKSIYDFNTRNARANSTIDKMTIKSYPWLCETVKSIVQSTANEDRRWRVENIISILKIHEKDLYKEWIVVAVEEVVNVETGEALARLAMNPKNILDNWTEYLERARDHISFAGAQRFVRMTRWYQDIPMKFAERCHTDVVENGDPKSIVVLGILMEGSEFSRVIKPFLPKDPEIDTNHEKAGSMYATSRAITEGMNLVNPPVPLDLIIHFCERDYLALGLMSMTNACRRTSVKKVQSFSKHLMDRPVSVKKHAIRLFCLVATIDDLRTFLSERWKIETHRSIRAIIFNKVFELCSVTESSPGTWSMMKNCIANLKTDDDDCLDRAMELSAISDAFIADYIKQLLETLEELRTKGFSAESTAKYVSKILRNINDSISNLLPEDLSEQLLKKYFGDPNVHEDIRSAGKHYAIHGYLYPVREKPQLESRLSAFCKHFEDILTKHWNVPHAKDSSYFPINHLTRNLVIDVVGLDENGSNFKHRTMESVLKSFLAVLKPEYDWLVYASLTYGIALKDAKTSSDIVEKIIATLAPVIQALTPGIINILPGVFVKWIEAIVDADKFQLVMIDLMESLCKIGTNDTCLLAARILLFVKDRQFQDRINAICNILLNSGYTVVTCLVYDQLNNRTLELPQHEN